MRKLTRLFCLLMALTMLWGCGPSVEEQIDRITALGQSPDDNYRTWYEIFVYSFCDSNGDGIGDLQGVRSKLDYLQDLGITGIWLMPIHPSTSYHKYNVSDYYAVDPTYGSLEDFEELLADCHGRGIKVILDLVVNHCGSAHPCFAQVQAYVSSLKKGERPDPAQCPYVEFFNITEEFQAGYKEIGASGKYYECRFSSSMPDLNLDEPAVRQEIRDIMAFWLSKGVDGFRLDAAKEYWTGNADKNIEVLSWIQNAALELKPDVYLVAEVWDTFGEITKYYTSGITSLFDFPFANTDGKIVSVLRGAGNGSVVSTYATALEKADKAYLGSNESYIDAPFLSNHDVGRTAGFVSQDENKTKLAGAMNLFMGGSAFIYYGEEIGMVGSGNDPSKRAPMYWNPARDDGTTQAPPECVLPDSYPFGSLEEQQKDELSVFNYYRQAIAIRNALPQISHGRTMAETALNRGCVSAQRKIWNDQECIILMNIHGEEAMVDLSGYEKWSLAATLTVNKESVEEKSASLILPPWAVAILIPAQGS